LVVALRVLIVGPGRVGLALARSWLATGVEVTGIVGRSAASTAAAATALGLPVAELQALVTAHVVVFAVGDAVLPEVVATATRAASPRRCSLWLHTSGRHDLDVFAGVAGIRRGSLHPVAPFPDPPAQSRVPVGAPGVIAGEPSAMQLLTRLCTAAGLSPVRFQGGDRALYHAACALAANGSVALRAAVEQAFAAAGGLLAADATLLAQALQQQALLCCDELGPGAALTGPVRRGDVETVRAHLARLAAEAPPAVIDAYRALMRIALQLAAAQGLPAAAEGALGRLLQEPPGS
jgi:predicted short-subunit dehydrogenase-like oxidoreductase (DUF2520 family)